MEESAWQASGAPAHLASGRLRIRLLSPWSLLWLIPAAAALAALLLFALDSTTDDPKDAKTAMAAPAESGPATTGSFSRPAASKAFERTSAERMQTQSGLAPPIVSATPAALPPQPSLASEPALPLVALTAPGVSSSPGQGDGPSRVAAVSLGPQAPDTGASAPAVRAAGELPRSRLLALSPDEIAVHLARGEAKLKAGELAAARLYFERVALAGDKRGALGMARTYDPAVLAGLPVLGPKADPAAAKAWYERAASERAGG
jgi:hypothetical protein